MTTEIVGLLECHRKRCYPRYYDALSARDLIKDASLEAYWCNKHGAFHLGHNRVRGSK